MAFFGRIFNNIGDFTVNRLRDAGNIAGNLIDRADPRNWGGIMERNMAENFNRNLQQGRRFQGYDRPQPVFNRQQNQPTNAAKPTQPQPQLTEDQIAEIDMGEPPRQQKPQPAPKLPALVPVVRDENNPTTTSVIPPVLSTPAPQIRDSTAVERQRDRLTDAIEAAYDIVMNAECLSPAEKQKLGEKFGNMQYYVSELGKSGGGSGGFKAAKSFLSAITAAAKRSRTKREIKTAVNNAVKYFKSLRTKPKHKKSRS
jgi:hypothetical protein